MPIEMQAPVASGKAYKVTFRNHVSSTGLVLLMVGWVPKAHRNVPPPQSAIIAPAAEAAVTGEIPPFADVHRMAITVSVDKEERGELQLDVDGVIHTVRSILETTTWEMVVV